MDHKFSRAGTQSNLEYLGCGVGHSHPAIALKVRRRDAKATTEHVQSSAGAASHRRRPHWTAPELSLLLRSHRPRPHGSSAATQFSRDAEVCRVWPSGPLHRRRQLTESSSQTKRPDRHGRGACVSGNASPRRAHQLMVPCLLVSTSSCCPLLNRKASMLRVRKVRACGSMTLSP